MLHTWGGWPAIDQSSQKEMSNIFRGIIGKAVLPLCQPAKNITLFVCNFTGIANLKLIFSSIGNCWDWVGINLNGNYKKKVA